MTAAPSQPADDDGTMPGPGGRRSGNALPDGTKLAEFEVRSVIGEGGFGIVYLVWDALLQRRVAIKEYMPATLAARSHGALVTPRNDKSSETFALGLRSFVNEAQLLASFDHPSLLKVYRFWEAHGTAYMVMPYYQGVTLKRALNALGAPPEEGWLLRQLVPLLDALDLMHRGHCYHRDIAPDNILLLDNGTPLLLDFGAARRVIGDATHALTAFLKPGYAPVEQYAEMPTMKQGPWTDLYALGSVVHYAISGRTPPESVARLVNDTMVPLATVAAGRYSERFLRAIDHALAVRPEQRPQSAVALRDELGVEERRSRARKAERIPTAPSPLDSIVVARDEPAMAPREAASPAGSSARPSAAPTSTAPRSRAAASVPSQQRVLPDRRARLAWWFVATVVMVAALGLAGGGLLTPRSNSPADALLPTVAPPAAPTAAPAAAPTITPGSDARTAELPPSAEPAPAAPLAPTTIAAPPPADPGPLQAPAEVELAPGGSAAPTAAARGRPPVAAAPARPTPRKNSPNPRCTEIITRASLGEDLSAQDQAMLKGECRK